MKLAEMMRDRRQAILDSWRKLILGSYSRDGSPFPSRGKDQFTNPIGTVVASSTAGVVDALASDSGRESIADALDPLIRMRAVQDFSPAGALEFVFHLKTAVRDAAGGAGTSEGHRELDRRVDEVALIAFDLYVACRAKTSDLRVRMMRDRSYMLMKRAGMLWEEAGDDTEVAGPMRGDAL